MLTQLSCGACLLIGTIGLVLVQQNKTGSALAVGAWLATAMAGLVFGGLIYRGGLVSMIVATAIDAGFGLILLAIEYDTLRKLLRILPASDVGTIGDALDVVGFAMLGAAVACLIALPQGIRFARWFHAATATRNAMSTARGFPPPVPARATTYIIPADEAVSRRRLYLVLGGLAIGVGAGLGVLVSSSRSTPAPVEHRPVTQPGGSSGKQPRAGAPGNAPPVVQAGPRIVGPGTPGDASGSANIRAVPANAAPALRPGGTVASLLTAQRDAIAKVDVKALDALMSPAVFGFGIDADELAEGRDAVVEQIVRDLGEPPPAGYTVESKVQSIGDDRDHAWIAEELEVGAAGRPSRRLAITELAVAIEGAWRIVALHWATPVADEAAERLAILKTIPTPQPIPDRHDGSDELNRAVRTAFASRAAFAEAYSERPTAFNYGSGGERVHGGVAIKRLFTKLKAQIRLHDGARVVAGSHWDPAQSAEPWIGWAAVNVDFTSKTRAATDITQTFRVLAIMLKDGTDWTIVQTHWSNGGPIR